MEPAGWLEVTDIYLRNEQAKFLNCAAERSFGFSGLHFHDNWRLPEYRRLVAQGVLWSLKLPIPADVKTAGEGAVRRYQDEHRLAYQADALVNWCAGLEVSAAFVLLFLEFLEEVMGARKEDPA